MKTKVKLEKGQLAALEKMMQSYADQETKYLREKLISEQDVVESLREQLKEKEEKLDRVFKLWENQRQTIERFHSVLHKHFGYDNYVDSEFLDKQLSSQSTLIESLAGALNKWQNASLVPYDREKIIQIRKHGTEALTKYNNYKNKQNGKEDSGNNPA